MMTTLARYNAACAAKNLECNDVRSLLFKMATFCPHMENSENFINHVQVIIEIIRLEESFEDYFNNQYEEDDFFLSCSPDQDKYKMSKYPLIYKAMDKYYLADHWQWSCQSIAKLAFKINKFGCTETLQLEADKWVKIHIDLPLVVNPQ